MDERDREKKADGEEALDDVSSSSQPIEKAFQERLRSVKSVTERRTLSGLARELGKLPGDAARAALETSAVIAGVSLRASIEFLRAAPLAALVLEAEELRTWGEIGRRLAMGDAETAVAFFASGVEVLGRVPRKCRPLIFQICTRQMTLSSSVATETFRRAPLLAEIITDAELLRSVLEVAAEISRRSAKHSADFLNMTPRVVERLGDFDDDDLHVARAAVRLAAAFAARAGGIAADAWAAMPSALFGLNEARANLLLERAGDFLERGGGAALHVMVAGGEILRTVPEAFVAWIDLLWTVAEHGNAALVAFVRSSPALFTMLAADADHARAVELAERIINVTRAVARVDGEAALACFRSSPKALKTVSIEQFEQWARDGLQAERGGDARSRRSYYALETRRSNDALQTGGAGGLGLEEVQQTLRLYVEGLTGHAVEIAPLSAVPDEARIGDGRTIHLPSMVAEFGDDEKDFRLYKVLAAHAAGQIEFGTHEREAADLRAAYSSIADLYAPENADARDAFALDGYINEREKSEAALAPEEEARRAASERKSLPPGSDYRAVLSLFPNAGLARRIFGTLENGRIDRRLRQVYRGLARDLDLTRDHLRSRRPRIIDLPVTLVPFELLFQITLCGGALDDTRAYYGQIVSELEGIVADYLTHPTAAVADTLMATSRVYSLFQSITPDDSAQQSEESEEDGEASDEETTASQMQEAESRQQRSSQQRDARELFNAWANTEPQHEPDELDGAEVWTQQETPEQRLEAGEVAFNYDEWDRELTDHRVGWCRVIEKRVQRGAPAFVEQTRERYRGVISSIRHQFQMMKPESLMRIAGELDGDDYDLNAVIDYVVDRRADGQQSERLYTKRLRRRRDVAVSFLLDQSSSTARTIGRHPLQPYTHPGRRIIEIEKEGLVLMSEALEAVGDSYSINGFTSEGRRNVKFYVVKDFNEAYSEEVERRIGGISYQNNTRLGAAIRHASARLARQEARTRLLIVLSDGRPYDHDYGDARYAREDTREALRQAKTQGITPFCITIDRESEAELRDLYGDIGYTIIDDVLSLPERMPGIYKRLTKG
ncbi:MAG TPA: VWA domain-containing protein [Pyrinomonadaceae bacterium]|nr:VWA domain-containing protein [Pyrinomonadaceae bacterium]